MTSSDSILLIASGLIVLSILFTRVSGRLGIPSLIVFLAVGMLAGPEGIGKIFLNNPDIVRMLGVAALINILFSGGIESRWADLKPVLGRGLLLATVGLCVNAVLLAIAVRFICGIDWLEGLLFGSIIGCTDVAAVFAVLRAKRLSLSGGLGSMAELESASNDPMAVFLYMTFLALITSSHTPAVMFVPQFFLQMGVGGAVGFLMGRVIPAIINSLELEQEGLYPPLTMAISVLVYAIATLLHGSGFLAAYVAGVVMNGQRFYHKRSLIRFHSGLAWLMQIIMFVALGLIIRPSSLWGNLPQGLLVAAILIFVARPISVIATLAFSGMSFREMLMVSWLGLRGAVPIILGTFTLYSGIPHAALIADLVFFIVLLSVLIQGMTLDRVARWLRLAQPISQEHALRMQSGAIYSDDSVLTDIIIPRGSRMIGKSIMSLGLDANSMVLLLHRDGATIVPTGRTRLSEGDVIVLLAAPEVVKSLGV